MIEFFSYCKPADKINVKGGAGPMRLDLRLLTWWRGQFVGQDDFGNKYYQDRKARRDGKIHRWVVYYGQPEATKVPASWHGWLHYTVNEPPQSYNSYSWEQPHQRNLTGTIYAYKPKNYVKKPYLEEKNNYQAWTPD